MKRLLVIGSMFVLAACSKGGGTGEYVVKVGDVVFTAADVQAEMALLPPMSRMQFIGPEGTARFVDELVRRESLYLEAKKRGVDQDKEVQRKMAAAQKVALVNYFMDKEKEAVGKASEKDIQAYYDAHKDDYINRTEVRYSQIVVKTPDEAQKVLARLQAGEDFAKVATEVSLDKDSAKVGGDKGYCVFSAKNGISPELINLLVKQKRGVASEPVVVNDRLYILKVTDIKGDLITFEQVKMFIPNKLGEERKKAVLDKIMESTKNNFKVDINKAALAKVPPVKKLPPVAPH